MEGPIDHSDSDSGESWTLLDHDVVLGDDLKTSTNRKKSFIAENSEKDDDTDGISIISDSEAESPSSFVVHSLLKDQSINEEIPVYSPQDIDIETNINSNENEDTEPLVEDNITGDNIKHKIYVHKRNNRLSTVLNIMMLVSVMTAAGVAIGHMLGAKNDCTSQTTPSFNKILSDLYKLQAENANYRNKLRELSLIIEDNLHSECERESNASLNNEEETVKCRQQKIHEIQKYLKSNAEVKRNKRTPIPISQKQDESKLRKYTKTQNISKINAIDEQELDVKLIPKDHTVTETYDQMIDPKLKEERNLPESKISYADSLKSNNLIKEDTNENVYKVTEMKMKHRKKPKKDLYNLSQISISEDDLVKDSRYSTPKHKLELKKHDRQKLYKNTKRRHKHEDWELKEGLLKYYDDLSIKLFKDYNFVKSRTNEGDIRHIKIHKKIETDQDKVNPYNDYFKKGEMENDENSNWFDNRAQLRKAARKNNIHKKIETDQDKLKPYNDYFKKGEMENDENSNWFDNRAQLRKEARKKLQLQLNVSNANPAEWHFKRMQRREQCRSKENCTYKRKGFKPKL